MQPDQNRLIFCRLINHNRQMFLTTIFRTKRDNRCVLGIFQRNARFADLPQGCGRCVFVSIDALGLKHQKVLRL